jgi:hypothetical protein
MQIPTSICARIVVWRARVRNGSSSSGDCLPSDFAMPLRAQEEDRRELETAWTRRRLGRLNAIRSPRDSCHLAPLSNSPIDSELAPHAWPWTIHLEMKQREMGPTCLRHNVSEIPFLSSSSSVSCSSCSQITTAMNSWLDTSIRMR